MQLRAIVVSEETLEIIAQTGVVSRVDLEEMKKDLATPGYDYYFIPNIVDPAGERIGTWALVPKDTFEAVFSYPATKIYTEFVEIHKIV